MAKIIVIGASQGGVQALHKLILGLPEDFATPILVVQHIGAAQSILPTILSGIGGLKAQFGRQDEVIEPGHIYVAPPDQHMLIKGSTIELTLGPRENFARPAVDPLFRSAAYTHGADAIGIVMSGNLNDGTAGLYEIKRHGGIAIVQSPDEAEAPSMPRSAIEDVTVDYCLPIAEMPRLLARLVKEPSQERTENHGRYAMDQEKPKIVEPSAQTCPECGGAMREEHLGSLVRFRCHIGHVMTAQVLAATQLDHLVANLSRALRHLNERSALCRQLADKQESAGNAESAEAWRRAAEEARKREMAVKALAESAWLHPEAEAAE